MGLTKGNALYNIPFTGNLSHDLELNTNTASGIPRLNFRLAVNEGERGSDDEKTHFIPFTAFGTTAENAAKSFKKGDRLIVLGRVNTYPKSVYLENANKELEEKEITMVGFTASDISAPVRFATVDVHKVAKKEGGETSAAAKKAPAPRAAAASKPKVAVPAGGGDDDF
ncbi:single-stranded DNA-binding protein [Pseudarthrobacter chlorophenolicus]|nr:single-stranded DNA-binding protein [Pseudarthrobacter chlorophenolicus]